MEDEIQQLKPKRDYKIHLAVFITFFLTSAIVGGAVFFYGAMQNIRMQKHINVLKGEIYKLEKENKNLLHKQIISPVNSVNKICGPNILGNNYDIDYCNRSCVVYADCKDTCGCGAINKDEYCDEGDIIHDCVVHEVGCENGLCKGLGEKIINNITECNTDGRGRVFGNCFNDCLSRIEEECTFACPHYAKDFNFDPANTTVEYVNKELGISLKLPYNESWGKENCQVNPYKEYNETCKCIKFGKPGGWEVDDEFVLTIKDSMSEDLLVDKLKNEFNNEKLIREADIEILEINDYKVVKWYESGMDFYVLMEIIGVNNNYNIETYLGGSTFENKVKTLKEIIKTFNEDNKTTAYSNCQDGFTYMSYYPNFDGSIEFQSNHMPSEELKKIRAAYYTFFACSDSDEEGYYIKQNDNFQKVEKEEFNMFIGSYNVNCNNCLTEHFDGCC